ncbi:MAG: hypothetical protein K5829_12260 [Treponema sp.]|nr:hypothetical protein [Treponema sp.]
MKKNAKSERITKIKKDSTMGCSDDGDGDNNTSDSSLKYASQATYNAVKQNRGQAVAPVTGDNSKGVNQKDSNVIIKVTRDRECDEWVVFPESSSGANNYKAVTDSFDADNDSYSLSTCKEMNENKSCKTYGSGYINKLDVNEYLKSMTGEWANKDFSGFAVPNLASLDKKVNENYSWKTESVVAGSTAIFTDNEEYASKKICKSYPEKDSPYNFSDKYKVDLYKCSGCGNDIGSSCNDPERTKSYSLVDVNRDSSLWSGVTAWCVKDESNNYTKVLSQNNKVLAFTYEQFKNFVPRDYFQQVKSGITLPYEKSSIAYNEFLIWVDDEQECYYQKLQYTNYNSPSEQYFGGDGVAPQEVCYTPNSSGQGGDINIAKCQDTVDRKTATINKEKTSFNNINNDSKQGYCIEYDYSKEIYYSGSGKYNCITWIPGYVK